jgi:hypothetical protein
LAVCNYPQQHMWPATIVAELTNTANVHRRAITRSALYSLDKASVQDQAHRQ